RVLGREGRRMPLQCEDASGLSGNGRPTCPRLPAQRVRKARRLIPTRASTDGEAIRICVTRVAPVWFEPRRSDRGLSAVSGGRLSDVVLPRFAARELQAGRLVATRRLLNA